MKSKKSRLVTEIVDKSSEREKPQKLATKEEVDPLCPVVTLQMSRKVRINAKAGALLICLKRRIMIARDKKSLLMATIRKLTRCLRWTPHPRLILASSS
jgi:hypothetical protein